MRAALPRLLLAACLGLLAGCSGNDARAPGVPTPPSTFAGTPTAAASSSLSAPVGQTVAVTVAGGKVTPKPGRVKVALGKPVTLRVTSDVADEVHVHGYDLKRDVAAGGTATVTFTADVPGLFEVEVESRGLRLLELQVS